MAVTLWQDRAVPSRERGNTDKFIEANRRNWNDRTRFHAQSAFYDVEGFLAGKSGGIPEHEQVELGSVNGKRLLHLQCHFGMDTLGWARLGALVTGVDISDEAIQLAQSLASQLQLPARFIRANIFDLPDVLKESFDIVYATYGVMCWVPDVDEWARIAAGYLCPGGVFYLADDHPFASPLADNEPFLDPLFSYFHNPEPMGFEHHGSYAGQAATTFDYPVTYVWQHSLGEIITAVIHTGLHLDFVHEFAWATYQRFPQMQKEADGRWHLPGDRLPMIFSIRATKP